MKWRRRACNRTFVGIGCGESWNKRRRNKICAKITADIDYSSWYSTILLHSIVSYQQRCDSRECQGGSHRESGKYNCCELHCCCRSNNGDDVAKVGICDTVLRSQKSKQHWRENIKDDVAFLEPKTYSRRGDTSQRKIRPNFLLHQYVRHSSAGQTRYYWGLTCPSITCTVTCTITRTATDARIVEPNQWLRYWYTRKYHTTGTWYRRAKTRVTRRIRGFLKDSNSSSGSKDKKESTTNEPNRLFGDVFCQVGPSWNCNSCSQPMGSNCTTSDTHWILSGWQRNCWQEWSVAEFSGKDETKCTQDLCAVGKG